MKIFLLIIVVFFVVMFFVAGISAANETDKKGETSGATIFMIVLITLVIIAFISC